MKKLFTLLALLVCAVGTVLANHWTPPTGYSNEDRLVVKAILSTNIGTPDDFEIGAFIGSSLRGSTAVLQTANNGDKFFLIEVWGNTDEIGKKVTFKAYKKNGNPFSDCEFALPETTTFIHGTYPDPSTVGGAMTLTLKAATTVTINPFDLNVGDEVTLADKLTIEPSDGVLPEGCYWALAVNEQGPFPVSDDFAIISEGKLTALAPCSNHELFLVIPCSDNSFYLRTGTFNVLQPATSITIDYTSIQVDKDDQAHLVEFMSNAYTVVPGNTTDEVKWEIEDPTIITLTANGYYPAKGGTTRMRPYIERTGGNLYPPNDTWITVTVKAYVESITFNPEWWKDTFYTVGENPSYPDQYYYYVINCNVGDDIYDYIVDHLVIEPGDASDKSFSITASDNNHFQISDHSIKAIAKNNDFEYTTIIITANSPLEGTYKPMKVCCKVYNEAKQVTIASNPLVISNNKTISGAASAIAQNISLPQGTSLYPNVTATIASTGVIEGTGSITDNGPSFQITTPTDKLESGTATVTVNLPWVDFFGNTNVGGRGSNVQKTYTTTFAVNVTSALMGFNIIVTPNNDDPTQGIITLEPNPSDADFDDANVNVTVVAPQYGNWTVAQVSGSGLSWTYSTALPGSYTVHAYESSNDIDDSKGFEVPALVDLVSGWQWKSNPYGNVAGDALQTFFGKNIIEARTQEDLFYNDLSWGFWGSMTNTGIPQAKMYKARMNFPVTAQATNGSPMEGDEVITLQPGWNWVGSPYFYDRLIAGSAVDIEDTPNGIVIISKADGSAELGTNHQWSGNLKVLKKGEGYLFYNPTTAAATIKLKHEAFGGLPQGNETPAGARGMYHSVWHYDHSQFANNMTMVAEMPELINESHYTIGAFVGDECRGEGSFEDGLAFITVHCNMGEQVSFRLHNELTDEYFDIDQTVTSRQRMGSLSEPFHMTSASNEATGITTLDNLTSSQSGDYYDLNGRNLSNSKWSNGQVRKGVQLQRQKNGTIRKVVR